MDGWKEILPKSDLAPIFKRVESKLNEQSELDGKIVLSIPFAIFDCCKN
jgi:hypothetical protein